ncbi:hypothetical protein [Streptomyces sp. NPDC001970]
MLIKRAVLAVGIVVAAGLPTAGTAAAEQGTAIGRITVLAPLTLIQSATSTEGPRGEPPFQMKWPPHDRK